MHKLWFRGLILGVLSLTSACVSRDQYEQLAARNDSLTWVVNMEEDRNQALQTYVDLMLRGNSSLQRPIILQHKVEMKAYDWQEERVDREYEPYYVSPPIPDWLSIDFPTSLAVRQQGNSFVFMLESSIEFDNNSADIPDAGQKVIQTLAEEINKRQDYIIRVEGHADPSERWIHPREADSWTLSVMRAVAVTRGLEAAGIPSRRLIASGRGEYYPAGRSDSLANKLHNRRVLLYLTPTEKLTDTP